MPVNTQCCAATDGSASLNVPWRARLRRTRHFERKQAYLVFLIFGQWNKMKTSFAQISSFKV